MCVVVPKAAKLPSWVSVMNSFTGPTRFVILLTSIICTMFWYWISSKPFAKASWTMFSILLGTPTKLVPRTGQYLFLAACMVFSIIILGVFQGSLFKNYTTTTYYADIDTLEELDQSGLPVAMTVWRFMKADSDLMRRLQNKTIRKYQDSIDSVAYQRNIAMCETKSYLQFLMKTKYVDNDGSPLLHVVDECLTTFLMGNLMPKGSAFLTVFNNVITKVTEAGLTVKWDNDIVDSLTVEQMINLSRNQASMIYTEDYWLVYQSHFLFVNFLTVQVLQTSKHRSALNQFTQSAIKIMNSYDYIISIKTKEKFLTENIEPRLHYYNATVRHGVLPDFGPIERKELIQMKSLISDAAEGYVIVAWHPKVVHQFLDQDYRIVVPKVRATYALQFIFSTTHLCKTVKIEMDNLLRRLWLEYNVVNVIAQSMCSCDTSKIYIFRPFIKTDNLWGLTEYYHLQEVVTNFRVITNPLKNFN
ncbi:hypothetical protein GEV33_001237 [Tenebrio molitor]|uniref:Uncharacterized protein n=1 Tax=Tenebrio molitor TaxID=7067 RepID=A0A8J6HVP9_TENMO|nr:hypothetical protein GEV33_001237 [Tenebrio molitor]